MKSGKLQKFYDIKECYSATLRVEKCMIKFVLRVYDSHGKLVFKRHFGSAERAKEHLESMYPQHSFYTTSGYVFDEDED